ncbi:uncharacterized protein [Diabrotica undecimpunctata]|uniref:uncharacterized protein n=1 Tax=Diabrotica undecimpunctata TaxID=50387 RepID=UPI003B632020
MLTKFVLIAVIIASATAQLGHYAGSKGHSVPDVAYRFTQTNTGSSSTNNIPNRNLVPQTNVDVSSTGNSNTNTIGDSSNPNLISRFGENFVQGQSGNNIESWSEDDRPSVYVNPIPIYNQQGFKSGRHFPYENNEEIRGGNSPIKFSDSRSFQVLRSGRRKTYVYNPEFDAWYPRLY